MRQYHGGSTMVHLGRAAAAPVSTGSLRAALFDDGDLDARARDASPRTSCTGTTRHRSSRSRSDPAGAGLDLAQPGRVVTGPTWGGNLEILHWNAGGGPVDPPADDYAGCVLLLETSEEMPPAEEVFRILRNFGERGLLAQFPAS